jgi:peptidoglycan hydrolase CwlO-like protein
MKKHLTSLLLAVLLACAAVVADRHLFRLEADALDVRIRTLEAHLARSEALRDSLDQRAARQRAHLRQLATGEATLAARVQALQHETDRLNRELAALHRNPRRYEVLPPDSVLTDLNRIVHHLRSGTVSADRLPR